MATTYDIDIESVLTIRSEDNLNKVVKNIAYWIVAVSDDNLRTDIRKTIELPLPNPDSFIDFNSIDKETMISWIKSQPDWLTEGNIIAIEACFTTLREKEVTDRYYLPFTEDARDHFAWHLI